MGDLFGAFTPINPNYQDEKLDQLIAYEEHYMKLIRNYQVEIKEIEEMMSQIRQERELFYSTTLPEIEKTIDNDNVLSKDAKVNWISELRSNMEKSFSISESLISHYVTSNLEEFKIKMKSEIEKV